MPELPEVQTTVDGLTATVVGHTITHVWTDLAKTSISRPDFKETIKYLPFFESFKKTVTNQRIISATRRAKNILLTLENGYTIIIHLKMTGHLLYGEYIYNQKENTWTVSPNETNDALRDPYNRFIHFVFELNNGKNLVLCDSRKFGKITLVQPDTLHESKHIQHLGPEILEPDFDFTMFKTHLLKKPRGKIKTVLMDQTIISGVGNIYSDEALWLAGIHPCSVVSAIPQKDLQTLFSSLKKVLLQGIDFGGDSMSDYRRVDGTRGNFQHKHNAYRLTHTQCKKPSCIGDIIKTVVGGRSAHFCNEHQKLFS